MIRSVIAASRLCYAGDPGVTIAVRRLQRPCGQRGYRAGVTGSLLPMGALIGHLFALVAHGIAAFLNALVRKSP
jgi:hypothetical protein